MDIFQFYRLDSVLPGRDEVDQAPSDTHFQFYRLDSGRAGRRQHHQGVRAFQFYRLDSSATAYSGTPVGNAALSILSIRFKGVPRVGEVIGSGEDFQFYRLDSGARRGGLQAVQGSEGLSILSIRFTRLPKEDG